MTVRYTNKSAVLSECGTYRYCLRREWGVGRGVCWVMLNPSTADALVDDPTIKRCVRFSHDWGYKYLVVVNLFGLRSTNPDALRTHPNPVGPDNNLHLKSCAEECASVVVGWGANADRFSYRVDDVLWTIRLTGRPVYCLGLTKSGQPQHPLFLPTGVDLMPYCWSSPCRP